MKVLVVLLAIAAVQAQYNGVGAANGTTMGPSSAAPDHQTNGHHANDGDHVNALFIRSSRHGHRCSDHQGINQSR
ncbi:hypothetical protein RvY_06595 [Ramazzottius varieornatus]|uniref:Uncharacterized protein n=1 Tax=Ramazzottius varieornatus TaxID=947166 RepID=A0A1D1UZ59_RAMVA|nr:hypothetical protein RvY_06595 [Ramazzottius varieornatus]